MAIGRAGAPGLRDQEELDVVHAVRPRGQEHRTRPQIDGQAVGVLTLPDLDDEPRVRHRQLGELGGDGLAELGCGLRPALREIPGSGR